jgi:hypothetical protein
VIAPDQFPDDLTGEEAAAWWPLHIKNTARGFFEKFGEVRPLAIMLCRRDPKTGLSYPRPRPVPVLITDMSNETAKENTAATLRKMAGKARAAGIGFMHEAWMLIHERAATAPPVEPAPPGSIPGYPPTADMPDDVKEFQDDYRANWAGRLEHHPDRAEVVIVTWQHRAAGTGGTYAEIVRGDANSKALLAAWRDDEPGPAYGIMGRFVDLLPPEDG